MVAALAAIAFSQILTPIYSQGLGNGRSYTLQFGPRDRVFYRSGRSMFEGKFSVQKNTLTLQIPNATREAALPSTFQIINWDRATFLLGEDEIPFFFYKLKKGWKGEQASDGEVGFLRNDYEVKSQLSGEPQLPLNWRGFTKLFTLIHCGYDDHGPTNVGTNQGAFKGAVLKQIGGDASAWVEDVDPDQSYVYRLGSAKLRPGQRMEASESPVPWRKIIKQKRAEIAEKGGY